MKKIILTIAITILAISLSLLIILIININLIKSSNNKVIKSFNKSLSTSELALSDDFNYNLPKLEINNKDYIGIISIPLYKLSLPVTSECSSNILNLNSSCRYSKKPFIILGNNLKSSFKHFDKYNVNDELTFTNTLGQTFQYEIKEIVRINDSKELSDFDNDLIIVIENYYDRNYLLLICDFN